MKKLISSALLCLSAASVFAVDPAAMTGAAEIFADNAALQVWVSLPPEVPGYEGFAKMYQLDGKGTLVSETEFRMTEDFTPGTTVYDYEQMLTQLRPFDWNDFDYDRNAWKRDLHYSTDWIPEAQPFAYSTTATSRILTLPDVAYETVYDASARPVQVNIYGQVKPRLADKYVIKTYKYSSDSDHVPSSLTYTVTEGSDDDAPDVKVTENYSGYQFNDKGSWVQRTVQVTRYYPDTHKTVQGKPYTEIRQITYQ